MPGKLLILILSASICFFMGCAEQPCAKASLDYRLVGFTDQEVDTIVLRRLPVNGSVAIDSFIFNPANPIQFTRHGDSLAMAAYPSTALLENGYDYQLYFPGAARTIRVTSIYEEQLSKRKNGKTQCLNEIKSFKADGMTGKFYTVNGIILEK